MKVVSALLSAFYFIIIVRIILSWFPSGSDFLNRLKMLVHKITEPYMKHFSGISWLRFGMFDFSPVMGLMVLTFVLYITQRLAVGYFPSLGELLVVVIQMIWSLFAFLLTVVAIVMIVRLVTLYAMKGRRPNWIDRLDAFLFPRVSRIIGMFTGKTVSYPVALGVSAVLLLAVRFGMDQLLGRILYPLILKI